MDRRIEEKVVQSIMQSISSKLGDRYVIGSELDDGLRKKYIRVGKSEKKYTEVLKYNIIYYKNIIKMLEKLITVWIRKDYIMPIDSVEKKLEEINQKSLLYMENAMKNGCNELNDSDREIYYKYDELSGVQKLDKLEKEYKVLNLYKDVFLNIVREISYKRDSYAIILGFSPKIFQDSLKVEVLNFINETLFKPSNSNFKDEALVNEEEIRCENEEEDNCNSFKKYVSMISNPEIAVKINDSFYKVVDTEELDEESVYQFTTDMKEYVSCIVLLMDYLPEKGKIYFTNLFKLFGLGKIGEEEFMEYAERYIRDHGFLDQNTWKECQKSIGSKFNVEKSKFFGHNNLKNSPNLGLDISDVMDILFNADVAEKIDEEIELNIEKNVSNNSYKKSFDKVANKFNKFASKFKVGSSEEEYYDDYDEYDEEEYDLDEEEYEYEEKETMVSKIKKLFNKEVEEENTIEEEEEDKVYLENYSELNKGDSSRQSYDAMEILRKKQLSKMKEDRINKEEQEKLKDERRLAEKINNGGFYSDNGVEFNITEDDLAHMKKMDSKPSINYSDVYDNTIDGKNTKLSINEINKYDELKKKNDSMNSDDYNVDKNSKDDKIDLKKSKNEISKIKEEKSEASESKVYNIGDFSKSVDTNTKPEIKRQSGKERPSKIEVSNIEKSFYKAMEKEKEKLENPNEHLINFEFDNKEEKLEEPHVVFEELEAMKAMKTEGLNITPVSDRKSSKVDLTSFSRKREANNQYEDRLEEQIAEEDSDKNDRFESVKDSIKKGIGSIKDRFDGDDEDSYPKKKMIRDSIIVVIIGVSIFFGYVFMIKNFKMPTPSDTNARVQREADRKNGKSKETSSTNNTDNTQTNNTSTADNSTDTTNSTTSEISQKTEAERSKEYAESQASALDRQAEAYRGGSGLYYTVFVGATKSKDGAENVATNFQRRGIPAKVIRNGGFYMLRVGKYANYNQAFIESKKLTRQGVQNYIASRNKYYDLKIEAYKIRAPYLTKEQLTTDYNDLKNQISSTGKNAQYGKNLDEAYNTAMNGDMR